MIVNEAQNKAIFSIALVLAFAFCGCLQLHAQQAPVIDTIPSVLPAEEIIQQRIEDLVEEAEVELDFTELLEDLEVFARRPLNLNQATANDLRRFFFLNDFQINNLLEHISKFGNLISIYELQSIDGFDLETITLLQPYVSVSEQYFRRHFSIDDMFREGRSQLFVRFQQLLNEQKGFSPIDPEELEANPNARYLGSPFRLYSRYRFTYYNSVSFGITAEKDPGEEFFRGTQPQGFDFYSVHLFLRDFGRIRALAVGDFQVQFGQGLSLWSGMAFGKSSEAINVKKNGLGLRPYTSVDENNFMRGSGVTVGFGNFELTGFYSYKGRDANVIEYLEDDDGTPEEALVISSLQQSGLHRTPRELEGKNAVKERIYGGNLAYKRSNFSIGLTAHRLELGAELQRNLTFYNQFEFSGRENTNIGVDYNLIVRNFNFFGEVARSQNGGMAILNGVMMGLDPRLSLSIVHRKFDKNYQAFLGNAFGENTRVSNESGLYIGLQANIAPQWRFYAYADHFSFPWMKFRAYLPSRGYDYLAQINFRPARRTEIYLRYRARNKPLNSSESGMIRHLDNVVRQNIRLNFSYRVSSSLSMRNRIEYATYDFGNRKEKGFLIYHDVIFRSLESPLSITARFGVFDTDGFDSRIYAYENDVLYAFSFPFYSDKGTRQYLLVQYRVNRKIDLYARLAHTYYANRDSTGSGLDLVEGNSRTELKAQVRLRF